MDTSVYNFDPTSVYPKTTFSPEMDDILATDYYKDFDPSSYSQFWYYRPNKSVNLAFAVLFGISALTFLVQGILSGKKWLGLTIAMVSGCAVEAIGYAGRVMAYDDAESETPFFIQIVCLTIAPAFLAAGIYLCLSRIIRICGAANSRIKPRVYPVVFITCDIISLALQAAGGGLATIQLHKREDHKTGDNIMIAGLSFQVFTMLVFILLALEFAVRTVHISRKANALATFDSGNAALRKTWIFKGFLAAWAFATLCIFTRCVFRVAELSEGWQGELYKKQNYFIGFEGAVIVAAVFILNTFHPGLCLGEKVQEIEASRARTWLGRKKPASLEKTPDEFHVMEQNSSQVLG